MRRDFTLKYLRALELVKRPQGATIKELRKALDDASESTVYRLLDSLQEHGVPLYNELDPYGPTNQMRWKIQEGNDYEGEGDALLLLDQKERLLLSLVIENSGLLDTGDLAPQIGTLKEKLRRKDVLRPIDRAADVHVALKRKKDYGEKGPLVRTILTAVDKREVCSVTYAAASTGLVKTYDIHPLTIMEYDNGLYLIAAVPKHGQDIRVLAIDRIQKLTAKKERFTPPAAYDPRALLAESFGIVIEKPIDVELRFTAKSAPYIRERIWGNNQRMDEEKDGSLTLRFRAAGTEEIKRWVLSLGAQVRVLGPPMLRDLVQAEAEQIAAQYRPSNI